MGFPEERQPSPSGRQKSHHFKRCRDAVSVHRRVLAVFRARAPAQRSGAHARSTKRLYHSVTSTRNWICVGSVYKRSCSPGRGERLSIASLRGPRLRVERLASGSGTQVSQLQCETKSCCLSLGHRSKSISLACSSRHGRNHPSAVLHFPYILLLVASYPSKKHKISSPTARRLY
jgi:hypothetical protein